MCTGALGDPGGPTVQAWLPNHPRAQGDARPLRVHTRRQTDADTHLIADAILRTMARPELRADSIRNALYHFLWFLVVVVVVLQIPSCLLIAFVIPASCSCATTLNEVVNMSFPWNPAEHICGSGTGIGAG